MDDALTSLIAASIAFLGTHFALSHPLRAPLVKAAGEVGFQVIYSIVALASFGWMVLAFRAIGAAGEPLWNGGGVAVWAIASLASLIALTLFLGSFRGNPALPAPGAATLADMPVHVVFHVTRHPMMWGFALWAIAHILVSPTPRSLVMVGSIAFLALVGAHMQDRKKQALMGEAWSRWEAKTSYWPRWGQLGKAGAVLWLISLGLWLVVTWAHMPLAYIPAGIWRWVG
jgi:uncharacterized membrane protein